MIPGNASDITFFLARSRICEGQTEYWRYQHLMFMFPLYIEPLQIVYVYQIACWKVSLLNSLALFVHRYHINLLFG